MADKKQQALTSFFKPKGSSGDGPSSSGSSSLPSMPKKAPPPSAEPRLQPSSSASGDDNAGGLDPPVGAASGRRRRAKRPLEEDQDKANGAADRSLKRSKGRADLGAGGDARDGTSSKAARKEARSSPPPPAAQNGSSVPPTAAAATARTSRYVYSSSPCNSGEASGGVAGQQVAEKQDVAEDDEETRRHKKELHERFVKKLGHPDSLAQLKRRNHQLDEETAALDDEGAGGADVDGEDDEDESPPAAASKGKKGGKAAKLTPMEIQFLDIKRKHMDTVLIVEVGYKFRFFGEDARIAAKELSIVCIPGKFRYDEHPSEAHYNRFASASIPVHRLPVHAKRLVAAGHKVGVVRQIETAALKKVGDNRNAPFVRKLTNIYTKGTYVDELGEPDQQGQTSAPSGGYLLCITETKAKGSGTDEKVDVGIIAVQPATGDIIYDNFEDGFMRSEVETRLLHISPCEFLIVGDLTKGTDKLIQHLSGSSTNVFGERSRVERVPKSKTMAAEAYSFVTQFYAGKMKEADKKAERASDVLDRILKLPEAVTICLSAMITHLTEYGLEHIFDLTKYFQPFTARTHMLINGTTLESLEVYRNQTELTARGSLLWAIDKTQTRSGARLLRKWIGRPLLDRDRIVERLDAVEELLRAKGTPRVDKLAALVASVRGDLERSLIRIYYGKCTRPELLTVLQTLQRIASEYVTVESAEDTGFASPLVANAILSLPAIRDGVISHLDKINAAAARKDDKYVFFREAHETDAIANHKLGIAAVEHDLDAHRRDAAAALGKKGGATVDYVTVSAIEYLIEVPNTDLKKVPASWAKISGTKKLSRFHTPAVVRLLAERDRHRESLAAACDAAFAALLRDVAARYQPLRDAVAALAVLDCLLGLARVAAMPGYSRPQLLDQPDARVDVVAGRHPMAEHLLAAAAGSDASAAAGAYIPFSTSLQSAAPGPLAQLITGPNMGGKSSYVRSVALLCLLAQAGSFVPATQLTLTPLDAIFTRMGARDNLARGESTFMVEVSETAALLRAATPRSLVVLDELGRGTSTHDGAAIAHAVLSHVATETRCLTLFITHYQSLARVAAGFEGGVVRNVHMRFEARKVPRAAAAAAAAGAEAVEEEEEEITFLYEVAPGVAHRSYGLNVARLAHLPRRVVDVAAAKSAELEDVVRARRLRGAVGLLKDVLGGGRGDEDDQEIERLVECIEQL